MTSPTATTASASQTANTATPHPAAEPGVSLAPDGPSAAREVQRAEPTTVKSPADAPKTSSWLSMIGLGATKSTDSTPAPRFNKKTAGPLLELRQRLAAHGQPRSGADVLVSKHERGQQVLRWVSEPASKSEASDAVGEVRVHLDRLISALPIASMGWRDTLLGHEGVMLLDGQQLTAEAVDQLLQLAEPNMKLFGGTDFPQFETSLSPDRAKLIDFVRTLPPDTYVVAFQRGVEWGLFNVPVIVEARVAKPHVSEIKPISNARELFAGLTLAAGPAKTVEPLRVREILRKVG